MIIKTMKLIMESDKPITEGAEKLRGFFARKFEGYILLHHHLENNKLLYRYPRIQYKEIEGRQMVIGLAEGVEVLQNIYNQYDYIKLGSSTYQIYCKEIHIKEELFGVTEGESAFLRYEFISPWFALNEENYRRYKQYSYNDKTIQLQSILIQNILSMAKTFNYVVNKRIVAYVTLKESTIEFKGKSIIGLLGTFKINFHLPDFIGLGKSVSRGFGTVKQLK